MAHKQRLGLKLNGDGSIGGYMKLTDEESMVFSYIKQRKHFAYRSDIADHFGFQRDIVGLILKRLKNKGLVEVTPGFRTCWQPTAFALRDDPFINSIKRYV